MLRGGGGGRNGADEEAGMGIGVSSEECEKW